MTRALSDIFAAYARKFELNFMRFDNRNDQKKVPWWIQGNLRLTMIFQSWSSTDTVGIAKPCIPRCAVASEVTALCYSCHDRRAQDAAHHKGSRMIGISNRL